jgi:hypothetical protein
MAQRSHKIIVVLGLTCQSFFLKAQIFTPNYLLQQSSQKQKEYKIAEIKRSVFNVGVFHPRLINTFDYNLAGIKTSCDGVIYSLEAIDCTTGKIIRTPLTPQLPPYSNSLGLFCKKELQLDKITPVVFRFRLGSLDYVNWMEQKPNAIKPGSY